MSRHLSGRPVGRRPELPNHHRVPVWADGIPFLEARTYRDLKHMVRRYFSIARREFRVLRIEPDTTYPQYQGLFLVVVAPGSRVVRWRHEERRGRRPRSSEVPSRKKKL